MKYVPNTSMEKLGASRQVITSHNAFLSGKAMSWFNNDHYVQQWFTREVEGTTSPVTARSN